MFEEGSFRRRPRGFRRKCQALKSFNYYPNPSHHPSGPGTNNGEITINGNNGNDLNSPGSLYHPHSLGLPHHHLHYHSHESLSLNGLSQNGSAYPSVGSSANGTSGLVSSSSGIMGTSPGEYPLSPSSGVSVIQNNPFVYQHQPQNLVTTNGPSPSSTPSYLVTNNPYDPLPFYASSPPQQYENINYSNSSPVTSVNYGSSSGSDKGAPDYEHQLIINRSPSVYNNGFETSNHLHGPNPSGSGGPHSWILNYCGAPVTSTSYFGNPVETNENHHRDSVSPVHLHSQSNTPPNDAKPETMLYTSNSMVGHDDAELISALDHAENHSEVIGENEIRSNIGFGIHSKLEFMYSGFSELTVALIPSSS